MTAHDKGLMYCKVCKKAFDQKDHKDEHEDSHIINGKRYKCTEKLPDGMICRCQYKAWGSLRTHITNAHHKKLSEASYLKNEDMTNSELEPGQKKQWKPTKLKMYQQNNLFLV